ncbi:MAG: copper resistance CopC family protein [Janthinobacterium lividum]
MKTSSILAAIMAASALTLAPVQYALAHAHPKHQSPDAGASLARAPAEVSIEFDNALEPAFSTLQVTDAQGRDVTTGKSTVDSVDKKLMKVSLKSLPAGNYAVAWVAVASDGHRTQGHYSFDVR